MAAEEIRPRRRHGLELEKARRIFEAWEMQRYDLVGEMNDLALAVNRDSGGNFEQLKQQLQAVEEKCSDRLTEIESTNEQVEVLRKQISQKNVMKDYLENRLHVLKQRRAANARSFDQNLKEIEEVLAQREQKVAAQLEAIQWYNNVLGIRAEFSNAIKFIFTKINPSNPQQEFSCTVRLDKHTNKYAMLECIPYIKRSTDLLDDLNITSEFFEFMRCIRQEFENLVMESEGRKVAVSEWCTKQQLTVI